MPTKVALTVKLTAKQNRTGARYKFPASMLLLSSRYTVALRFEDLLGFDGAACRTPPLLRAGSSETEAVDFVTVAIGRPIAGSIASGSIADHSTLRAVGAAGSAGSVLA